jgi:hypothetical protein
MALTENQQILIKGLIEYYSDPSEETGAGPGYETAEGCLSAIAVKCEYTANSLSNLLEIIALAQLAISKI